MKKSILALLVFMTVAVISMGFAYNVSEKKLKVELTEQEWLAVIQVIEDSNAPYKQVVAVKTVLVNQLGPQVEREENPE